MHNVHEKDIKVPAASKFDDTCVEGAIIIGISFIMDIYWLFWLFSLLGISIHEKFVSQMFIVDEEKGQSFPCDILEAKVFWRLLDFFSFISSNIN